MAHTPVEIPGGDVASSGGHSDTNSDGQLSRSSTPSLEPESTHWVWANRYSIPWDKMPAQLRTCLKSKQRPTNKDRREMIRILCDDILQVAGHIGRKEINTICQKIVSQYPDSFRDMDQKTVKVVGSGHDSILYQLENRIYNLKRQSSVMRRAPTAAAECAEPQRKRARKDNYGCTNWGPALPESETVETQQTKMETLQRQYATREDEDKELIEQMMRDTYASQRNLRNQKTPVLYVNDILEKWPFLREINCLLAHFEELTGTTADAFDEALTGRNKGNRLYQFLQTFRMKKRSIATWCNKIGQAIEVQKCVTPQSTGVLPLLLAYFGEKETGLMKVYEVSITGTFFNNLFTITLFLKNSLYLALVCKRRLHGRWSFI